MGENIEKYITFSAPIKKKCDDGKTITYKLKFILNLSSFKLSSILNIFQETRDFLVLTDLVIIVTGEPPSSHVKLTKMWFGLNLKYLWELFLASLFCWEDISYFLLTLSFSSFFKGMSQYLCFDLWIGKIIWLIILTKSL